MDGDHFNERYIFIGMKKALVISPDWQDIEKILREQHNYIVRCKDKKEDALEWCASEKIDLIVGAYHKGILELSSSISQQNGNMDFLTQNPKIMLTWSPHFSEDRYEEPEMELELDEDGESIHLPNEQIQNASVEVFKKPLDIKSEFKTNISSSLSSFLAED